MAEEKEHSHKKSRKNPTKVRVKLPGIESYEKTLEFTAEGPGRVVVRLERLMGSDRIRITDPKYLATLVERLEAEEDQSWGSRSRLRKKAEKNRSRQLAIEGLMEPAEDMQDLYEHPVFRVNRVLNRLAVFDSNMSGPRPAVNKMPPIIPCEPFNEDMSGRIFRSYPQHQIFHKEVLPYANTQYSLFSHTSRTDLTRSSHHHDHHEQSSGSPVHSMHSGHDVNDKSSTRSSPSDAATKQSAGTKQASQVPSQAKSAMGVKSSTKSLYRAGDNATTASSVKPSEINLSMKSSVKVSKEETDDEKDDDDGEEQEKQKPKKKGESLRDFKLQYGVPSEANLVRDWQAFKSHLVERVYEETGGSVEELYELAGAVIGAYDRQLATVDDFIEAHDEKVKVERRALGLPSDPNVVEKEDENEAEDGDGKEEYDEEEYGEEGEGYSYSAQKSRSAPKTQDQGEAEKEMELEEAPDEEEDGEEKAEEEEEDKEPAEEEEENAEEEEDKPEEEEENAEEAEEEE